MARPKKTQTTTKTKASAEEIKKQLEEMNEAESKTVQTGRKDLKEKKYYRIIVEPNLSDIIKEDGFMYQGEILPFGTPIMADKQSIEAILAQKTIIQNKRKKLTPYQLAQKEGISIDEAVSKLDAARANGDVVMGAEETEAVSKYRVEYLDLQ